MTATALALTAGDGAQWLKVHSQHMAASTAAQSWHHRGPAGGTQGQRQQANRGHGQLKKQWYQQQIQRMPNAKAA